MSRIIVNIKVVPIEDCYPNPWNPNRMDQRTEEATRESIGTYGMVDPLTVRPHPTEEGKFEILDGEHRHEQCMEMGMQEIPVNILTGLTDAQAKKFTIIANETRGRADRLTLADLMAELNEEMGEDLSIGLPYTTDTIQELLNLAGANWETGGSGGDGEKEDEETLALFQIRCPQAQAVQLDTDLLQLVASHPEATLTVTDEKGATLVFYKDDKQLRVHFEWLWGIQFLAARIREAFN